MAWERITYFLDRVIPVCNEYKIRAACHPHDPGMPPAGFQGIVPRAGHRRRAEEVRLDPGKPLPRAELLRRHRRRDAAGSAQGDSATSFAISASARRSSTSTSATFAAIATTFARRIPTTATSTCSQVARTLHEVGYPYMLMPDHVPHHADDPDALQAFAFGYGYIKGLLQAIERV